MNNFLIAGRIIRSDMPGLNELLAQIYEKKERPLCLCKASGIEMYVAKIGSLHVLKRMPNTGSRHMPFCNSYEPPPELSGLGQVMGTAILENPDEGRIFLSLDFPLSRKKKQKHSEAVSRDVEHNSVKAHKNKLTLRGVLHYLWEEAGFNKWSPQMEGKRNWYIIRKYLLQASENKQTKGSSLTSFLYIPEKFSLEEKDAIQARRMGQIMKFSSGGEGGKKLMLVIGELKELKASAHGHKLILKHLTDYPFFMREPTYRQITKLLKDDFQLVDSNEGHLITVATFSVNDNGVANLEEIAFMPVDKNWVPIETMLDQIILDTLYMQKRKFIKGLRYNLKSSAPLATVVLSDTKGGPTAMYIVRPSADSEHIESLAELIQKSKLKTWRWDVANGGMPNLPD